MGKGAHTGACGKVLRGRVRGCAQVHGQVHLEWSLLKVALASYRRVLALVTFPFLHKDVCTLRKVIPWGGFVTFPILDEGQGGRMKHPLPVLKDFILSTHSLQLWNPPGANRLVRLSLRGGHVGER